MFDNKKCLECDKQLIRNTKFCNSSCSAKYNNRKYPKRSSGLKKPVCLNCNIELKRIKQKYCSTKCQMTYQTNIVTIPKILSGNCNSPDTLKKYIKKHISDKCSECGVGEIWNNKYLCLQLDHIDGNSDNNNLDNLRLLCPNCHSQTNTFGSNGYGSFYRKSTKRNQYMRKYKGYD